MKEFVQPESIIVTTFSLPTCSLCLLWGGAVRHSGDQ